MHFKMNILTSLLLLADGMMEQAHTEEARERRGEVPPLLIRPVQADRVDAEIAHNTATKRCKDRKHPVFQRYPNFFVIFVLLGFEQLDLSHYAQEQAQEQDETPNQCLSSHFLFPALPTHNLSAIITINCQIGKAGRSDRRNWLGGIPCDDLLARFPQGTVIVELEDDDLLMLFESDEGDGGTTDVPV